MGPRGWIIIVLIFLVAVFIAQNAALVEVKFLAWSLQLSRVLLLLGAVGAGVAIGFFLGWEVFRRRKRPPSPERPPKA
ncbi:MAG: lipopolysaccharide assembly protein LapA domain-containing protein [Nitrospirota bacterium]|jgi:putative membrane protein